VFVGHRFVFGWQDGGLWGQLQHPSPLLFAWKQRGSCPFVMEKGCLALKQRESIHFGDFWHFSNDFAQLNTAKTISKAEKAPSY
jgi:hypothetical protein